MNLSQYKKIVFTHSIHFLPTHRNRRAKINVKSSQWTHNDLFFSTSSMPDTILSFTKYLDCPEVSWLTGCSCSAARNSNSVGSLLKFIFKVLCKHEQLKSSKMTYVSQHPLHKLSQANTNNTQLKTLEKNDVSHAYFDERFHFTSRFSMRVVSKLNLFSQRSLIAGSRKRKLNKLAPKWHYVFIQVHKTPIILVMWQRFLQCFKIR